MDDGNFYFGQFKVTNRSESMVALNYLIELVYLDCPSIQFIKPSLFSANQFRDSFVMEFMHQAIHFGGVLGLIPDLSRNVFVVLIHDLIAESSFFHGLLNSLLSRVNPLAIRNETVWRLL